MSGASSPRIDVESLLAHAGWVRALARSLVFAEDRVDDVAQETWLAAIEHPPRNRGRVKSWLTTVTRRLAFQSRRGDREHARRNRAAARGEAIESTADVVERENERRRVVDAVLRLGEPYRSIVLRRFFEELPPREIAERFGVPIETVKTRLKRALEQLRAELDREHGSDGRAWCLALLPLARRSAHASAPIAALATRVLLMKKIDAVALIAVVGASIAVWKLAPGSGNSTRQSMNRLVASRAVDRNADASPSSVEPARRDANGAIDPPRSGPLLDDGRARATGIVIDWTGRPLADVDVISLPEDATGLIPLSDAELSRGAARAKTGAGGRFDVLLAGQAPFYTLVARVRDASPAVARSVRPGDELSLVAEEPSALVGAVMDATGKPVPNARIQWVDVIGNADVLRETTSGPDGRYRIEGLPSGPALLSSWDTSRVVVQAEGFARLTYAFDSDSAAPTGPCDVRADLVLIRGAVLKGRVLDAETGEPIRDASVRLLSTEWYARFLIAGLDRDAFTTIAKATSATDGAFAFSNVPAEGFHRVDVQGQGIASAEASAPGYAAAAVDVPVRKDGDVIELDVCCWPAGSVRGRVVDERGKPVAGASMLYFSPGRVSGPWRHAVTDSIGRYKFESLNATRRAPAPLIILAMPPDDRNMQYTGGQSPHVDVAIRAGEMTDAPDIVVPPAPAADFAVTDAAGRPIWGAQVTVEATRATARTDRRGEARISFGHIQHEKPPGPSTAIVRAHGCVAATTPVFTPSIEAPPLVAVALERAHHLSGIVLRADGTRAIGAIVHTGPATVRTAHDGSFELADLPAGPYDVSAEPWPPRTPSPCRVVAKDVEADGAQLVLCLPPDPDKPSGATLEVAAAETESGLPILSFGAMLWSGDSKLCGKKIAPGRSRFDAVPAGTWTLEVTAAGFVRFEKSGVEIAPDSEPPTPITIALERGATVRGTIRSDGAVDLSDLSICFGRPETRSSQKAHVARDGSYVLTGLPPGRYRAQAVMGDGRPSREAVILEGSSSDELLIPPEGGEIVFDAMVARGGWLDAFFDGIPQEQQSTLRWEVRELSGRVVRTSADPIGIHFSNDKGSGVSLEVLPGHYAMSLEAPGAAPQQREFTLAAGGHESVEFEPR